MLKTILFLLALGCITQHVFTVLWTMGFHKFVYNHKPGVCDFVKGIESGSEDVELVSDGTVLVASGFLPIPFRVEGVPHGRIYSLDFDHLERGATEVPITGDFDENNFHPHGFSLYEDKETGKAFLFVVNHRIGIDTIEIFQYDLTSKTLMFIRTASDPLMRSVNDVLAVGPDEFYLTNDGYSLESNTWYIEQMLRLHWGGVVFCSRDGCRQVSEPLYEANGITRSRNGRYIYVAHLFDGFLHIYERNADNSFLGNKPVQVLNLGTSLDNIYVDTEGDLWIGCHPVLYRAIGFFGASPLQAAAQVLRVRLHGSKVAPYQSFDIEEVFSHDGGNISLTSVAVYHKDRLLVGTVMGKMMYCTTDAL